MEYPFTRRRHLPTPSPCLIRSRSEAENNSASQRLLISNRSKSTTKSRNANSTNISNYINPNYQENSSSSSSSRDGFVRFLQRGSCPPNSSSATKSPRPKSSSGSSPSAWALSPGRSFLNVLPAAKSSVERSGGEREKVKRTESGGNGGRGGMSSVLKYFRQKKVSQMEEGGYHRLRVLHNRLLQWRIVNARAEDAMASVKMVAEGKLFHVWLRIFGMRNYVLEKRIQIQKLKHEIKLCQIINPQMSLLNDWAKLEAKNCQAVGRVTRKLSALSLKLPLAEDAKGDVESVHEAMNTAVGVKDSIEITITKFLLQVEKTLFLLTEFTSTVEHQKERLEEMEKIITFIAKLRAWEKSVRVHLLQVVVMESRGE